MIKRYKSIKFKNGATLLYCKDKRADYSAIIAGFFAGSSYNTKNGMAHLLEHIMMKQTLSHSRDELISLRASLVPSLNASTRANTLHINWHRANQKFDEALALTVELLTQTDFDEEILKNEKNVVSQEYARAKNNEQTDFAYNLWLLASSITTTSEQRIGSPADLEKITVEDLKNFRDKYFVLNNFFMSYVGNFSLRKIKKILKNKVFPFLPNTQTLTDRTFFKWQIDKAPDIAIIPNSKETISLFIVFPHECERDNNNRFAKDCLAFYLQKHQDGIYQNLRKNGLIYSSSTYISMFDDNTDALIIKAEFTPNNIECVLKEINASLVDTLSSPFSKEFLDTCKENRTLSQNEKIHTPQTKKEKCNTNLINFLYDEINGEVDTYKGRKYYDRLAKNTTTETIDKLKKEFFNKDNSPYICVFGNVKESPIELNHKTICEKLMAGFDNLQKEHDAENTFEK